VSNSDSIRNAAAQFAAIADRLDVLIDNAAVYPDEGLTILTVPRDRMLQTFQTNTFGPLEVTQALLPYLRHAAGARVISASSGHGRRFQRVTTGKRTTILMCGDSASES
jgi:NAD(P)-dependent dehydrogenase (short-subunit alcohol dehydrogenase family)